MIKWAGKSSDDVKVIVERYPGRTYAQKKLLITSIPGKSGDMVEDLGGYNNYAQEYMVYLSADQPKLPTVAKAAAAWLAGPVGYQRLEDSYEADTFRLAFFEGPMDIENILNRFGRATISFNCDPRRFLVSGETPVTLTAAGIVTGPNPFPALPLIEVTGSGDITLTVGDVNVEITGLENKITLDSETQNAYNGATNLNGIINAPDFPVLREGANNISWTGTVTSVKIIPRWWTL